MLYPEMNSVRKKLNLLAVFWTLTGVETKKISKNLAEITGSLQGLPSFIDPIATRLKKLRKKEKGTDDREI